MCHLAQPKPNEANSLNSYLKTKGYFSETCKSQNINLISPSPKFNFYIIQIIIKSLSTFLVLSPIKIYLPVQFLYLTFQPDHESGVCVKSNLFFLF